MKILLVILGVVACWAADLYAVPLEKINKLVAQTKNLFTHDLHLQALPGASQDEEIVICFHGMGSDYNLAKAIKSNPAIPYHVVSFNFPDYGSRYAQANLLKTTFGTIDELLPALYVLKRFVIDGSINTVHLYGFSAGGGALVNVLAVLTGRRYDVELKKAGIEEMHKKQMLDAVQNGSVILEVPLKSFDEVADLYGNEQMHALAQSARANGMTPIDNLSLLQPLSLRCFVYFTKPDAALGNRDDQKFIQGLRQANSRGHTTAIIGSGGHTDYHAELWNAYTARPRD